MIDLVDDDDAWDALDEIEGLAVPPAKDNGNTNASDRDKRPRWLPEGMDPVLEELPKWNLLADVLQEIEEEMPRLESLRKPLVPCMFHCFESSIASTLNRHFLVNPGSNTVLVMTSSTRTCSLLSEFLSVMDQDAPRGSKGRPMMLRKLRLYLWWKGKLSERKQDGKSHFALPDSGRRPNDGYQMLYGDGQDLSEALQKKDKEKEERSASRRRVRGGAPAATSSGRGSHGAKGDNQGSVITAVQEDAENFAEL